MAFEKDNQSPRLSVPPWLVTEALSIHARRIDREWTDSARASTDADRGRARLALGMLSLRARRPSRPLLARANARALRWVQTQLAETRQAADLRRALPALPWSNRMAFHCRRLAVPVAATFVLLLCRTGMMSALEGVGRMADRISHLHVDRHIGPMT